MSPQRTVITGGRALVGDPLTAHVNVTDVAFEDGLITEIAPNLPTAGGAVIDASGCWVIPGFVDTHRHLWQTTMRGLTANWNLNQYVYRIRFHFAGLHSADDVYAGQFAGSLDALSAGVTTTIDHCHITNSPDHADAAVNALADSGIRALWCYGFFPTPQSEPVFTTPDDRLRDAARIRRSFFPTDNGLLRMGVALTELGVQPFAETRKEIQTAADLAVPVTCHSCCVWSQPYINDVAVLHREGLLGTGQLHSHANKCTDTDLALLGDAGCSVASTPDTELQMGLGSSIFGRAQGAGVNAGIGIDIVSNNSGDMFTAMRLLLQHQRRDALQPALDSAGLGSVGEVPPVTTRQVLHAATLAGARALGLESVCGSIEVGKAADLVLLRNDRLHMRPVIDDIDSIVLQATAREIDRVIVNGHTVVEGGALPPNIARRGIQLIEDAHTHLAQRVESLGGWELPLPEAPLVDLAAAAFEASFA